MSDFPDIPHGVEPSQFLLIQLWGLSQKTLEAIKHIETDVAQLNHKLETALIRVGDAETQLIHHEQRLALLEDESLVRRVNALEENLEHPDPRKHLSSEELLDFRRGTQRHHARVRYLVAQWGALTAVVLSFLSQYALSHHLFGL